MHDTTLLKPVSNRMNVNIGSSGHRESISQHRSIFPTNEHICGVVEGGAPVHEDF